MSDFGKKVNVQTLTSCLEQTDNEIVALEGVIASLEGKISNLRNLGKPIPELPTFLEELNSSKEKLETLKKRRKELALVCYNQAILEIDNLKDDIQSSIKSSKHELHKLYKSFAEEIVQGFKKLVNFYEKIAGCEINVYDYGTISLEVNLKNEQQVFESLQRNFKPIVDSKLKNFIEKKMEPAKKLISKTQKDAGITAVNSRFILFDTEWVPYK